VMFTTFVLLCKTKYVQHLHFFVSRATKSNIV
jgi:hypothetical protein